MIAARLADGADYDAWRAKARELLAAGIAPENVSWSGNCGLFDEESHAAKAEGALCVPRAFVEIAQKAALHRDPARFGLLYRVLWRLQSNRALMQDAADPDIVALGSLAKAVRRDEHKMHAFVRFKEVVGEDGPRFVAWFEPQHYITRATSEFFVRRFAGVRWSIITPEASLHWDGATLAHGPGGSRGDVPADDARDEDWRTYYESMFNPARLKVRAMKREMPKHYWRNLPEAPRIAGLIREAPARAQEMIAAMPTVSKKRAGAAAAKITPEDLPQHLERIAECGAPPESLVDLNRALSACRACPLWCGATQAVAGEGPSERPLLALVGEQPGDQEDLAGKPFIGPAGKVLDRALEDAGIARGEIFVTNAVKHFKHELRGKRRLHKRPDRSEVEICRWWVRNELELVRPRLVVALGVTALQSLSSHRGALNAARDRELRTREGLALRATIHPSALLRLPDEADAEAEFARFVADLSAAKRFAKRAKA